jgi:hypothetical protein
MLLCGNQELMKAKEWHLCREKDCCVERKEMGSICSMPTSTVENMIELKD